MMAANSFASDQAAQSQRPQHKQASTTRSQINPYESAMQMQFGQMLLPTASLAADLDPSGSTSLSPAQSRLDCGESDGTEKLAALSANFGATAIECVANIKPFEPAGDRVPVTVNRRFHNYNNNHPSQNYQHQLQPNFSKSNGRHETFGYDNSDRRHQSTQTDTTRNTSRSRQALQHRNHRCAGPARSLSSSSHHTTDKCKNASNKSGWSLHNRFPSTGASTGGDGKRRGANYHGYHPKHADKPGYSRKFTHSRQKSGPVIKDEDFPDIIGPPSSIDSQSGLHSTCAAFQSASNVKPSWTSVVKGNLEMLEALPDSIAIDQKSELDQRWFLKNHHTPIIARYRSKSFDGNTVAVLPVVCNTPIEGHKGGFATPINLLQHSMSRLSLLKPGQIPTSSANQSSSDTRKQSFRILSRNADDFELWRRSGGVTSESAEHKRQNFRAEAQEFMSVDPVTARISSQAKPDPMVLFDTNDNDGPSQTLLSAKTPEFMIKAATEDFADLAGVSSQQTHQSHNVQYSTVSTSTTMDDPILIPLSDEDDETGSRDLYSNCGDHDNDEDWIVRSDRRANSIYAHGLVLSETLPRRFST